MAVTLVAYYGNKPLILKSFIEQVHHDLATDLGAAFAAYDVEQVHATIIGLEGYRIGRDVFQSHWLSHHAVPRPIAFQAIIKLLNDSSLLPFSVRIGGFQKYEIYPFSSQGQHPYLRTFSCRGQIAVAMGWPVTQGYFPLTLDQLRRQFNRANVQHKYHVTESDIDNDFFFVLGQIDRSRVTDNMLLHVQHKIRETLADQPPLVIAVNRSCLSLVAYQDTKLPISTSQVFSIDSLSSHLPEIINLYPERAMH